MDIEAIKGLFQDILRDYPDFQARYQYDEKRNWFGICIFDDQHHTFNYATETDEINLDAVRKEIDTWKEKFAV